MVLEGLGKSLRTTFNKIAKASHIDKELVDEIVRDIQRAVDRVEDLPDDVDDPVVMEVEGKLYPILEVSLSGGMSEKKLQEYSDSLEDKLEDIKGVAKIEKGGYRD